MSLPLTRDYTAVDGVTKFPAATDTALQDACIREWSFRIGSNVHFEDDFFGSAVDTGKWTFVDGLGAATLSGQSGASGCVRANITADGSVFLGTQRLDLAQRDFYWASRQKIVSVGGSTSGLSTGIVNATGAGGCSFLFNPAISATYFVARQNATNHITTIAPTLGAWFLLEIQRIAGVFSYYVDGVLAYSEAAANTLGDSELRWFPTRNTSGTTDMSIDYLKFWTTRS